MHPDEFQCYFEPGDVPGVDVLFWAQCTRVFTPSGNIHIVARGQLPEGYTLSKTFEGPVRCFGRTGHIVATTSGQVTAICHF